MRTTIFVAAAALAAGLTGQTPAIADVPTCLGHPATLVGTSGNDILKGSGGPDVIWAGPGWDIVYGFEGDDLICLADPADPAPNVEYGSMEGEDDARYGSEFAHGGGGDDKIVGGRGLNTARGGYGNDELWSISDPAYVYEFSTGDDYYQGGPGNDAMHGGPAGEGMWGGRGDDVIEVGEAVGDGYDDGLNWANGGPGSDRLVGGSGGDHLTGGKGDDRIDGASGDDRLYGDRSRVGYVDGWFGDDEILGGTGDDQIFGMGGTNTIGGGPGSDNCLDPTPAQGATGCEGVAQLP